MKKVYLAGPDVFRENAVAYGKGLKKLLSDRGIQGLYPFDNEIPFNPRNLRQTAGLIYEANIKMIQECDAVLANLEPFRGPSLDAGTAFEIGYAVALGKPVIGYNASLRVYELRAEGYKHQSPKYPNVESFGLHDNLMIEFGCGKILSDQQDLYAAIDELVAVLKKSAPEDQL